MTPEERAWSDREHLHNPRGALLIAAYGGALHGDDGVYRGFGPLVRQLCGGSDLPRGRGSAENVVRRQLMTRATEGLRIPQLLRQRIFVAMDLPGVEPWLTELRRAGGGVLSIMVLGRERADL